MDKGTFSNIVSASILFVGLILGEGPVQAVVLSAGMFAFSGGITNSLAVKMLFDRIPGLVGSGVIPARFEEIRSEIKRLILENFFSETFLKRYLEEETAGLDWSSYLKSPDGSEDFLSAFIESQWEKLTNPAAIRPIVKEQMGKLRDSPLGGFLMIVGAEAVENAITNFALAFVSSLKPRVLDSSAKAGKDLSALGVEVDREKVVSDLRREVSKLLDRRLEELTPQRVKRMMEDVIRRHLGWLVVWGNVCGGILGIAAYLLSNRPG